MVQCPLCSRSFPRDRVELHAATCEGRQSPPPDVASVSAPPREEEEIEIVDETVSSSSRGGMHKRMRNGGTTTSSATAGNKVTCPICNEAYSKSVIEQHAANCGDEVYV